MINNNGLSDKEVIINKGTQDGIEEGMAVVNQEGLIGVILDSDKKTSIVKLLTSEYNVSVKLTDTYGKFDDSTIGSQNGNEYIVLTKYVSKKISISLQVTTIKNSYGYNISQMVFIDTLNKDLQSTIAKKRIDKILSRQWIY